MPRGLLPGCIMPLRGFLWAAAQTRLGDFIPQTPILALREGKPV